MVATAVTCLFLRYLQIVRIRLLLVFVRIPVSFHRFSPLACLDGIGQIFDGSLQSLVPVRKAVYCGLYLPGISANAEQLVETSERHRIQQSSDTIHKGTAYLFEQVPTEDIVEHSGYRIEDGVYQ